MCLADNVSHRSVSSGEIALIVLTHSHIVSSFKMFPLLHVRQFYTQSAVDLIDSLTLLTYGVILTECTSHSTVMRLHALTRNSPLRILVFTARLPPKNIPRLFTTYSKHSELEFLGNF